MAMPSSHSTPKGAAVESSTLFRILAFRFAFAIAVLSLPRLAIFIPPHLWFTSLRRPVALVVGRCDIFEWQTTSSIGAFVVHIITGGKPSVQEMTAKFKSDWFASAIPDLVGLLMLAVVIAAVWTALDRRRAAYRSLNRWMRVYVRYGVATAMLSYAFVKVIPTQFGYVTPGEMLRPFGQFSRFQVLWDFMAVSPGYTIFTGLVELSGAVMLFFRRTTLVGGIVLAGSLLNVVVIDLAYGVGAVTYALALLLLDIVILAPYLKPLFDILVGRAVSTLPSEPSGPQQRWWHSHVAKAVLICVLALPLIVTNIQRRLSFFGSGRTVYGLFEVTTFVRNGHAVTPAASDSVTWKRVASDPRNGIDAISVQFANGDVRRFELTDDSVHHVWTIRDKDHGQAGTLSYGVRPDGVVSLDGRIGSDSVDILLHPVNIDKVFPPQGPA
ncbi:MAG: hypothetical protein IT167_31730 [Bryobacterales bacterium]|nr:hypothetical protein [Bryobacterales bacterium]